MEKLLTLLSILIICETTVSSVIAASLHEKKEIKDEVFNLQTEHHLRNLTRYKRAGEFDHIPDVSEHLRELLSNYVIETNRDREGRNLTADDFIIGLDIRVERIHEIIENGVHESPPELAMRKSETVENDDDVEKEVRSHEIILHGQTTDSGEIDNTSDISGEAEISPIPIIGLKRKLKFRFSRSSKTRTENKEDRSKKLPPQQITLEPHSRKKVVAELYFSVVTSKNLITFEVHDSSKYTLQFKGGPNELGADRNRPKKIYNLKEAAERYVRYYLKEYPAAIYDGLIPCIEFKDDKMYIRYYPLEITAVKTELYSHIESL